MSYPQLYYTSSKVGIDGRSGTAGWKIYAASPDCDQILIQNINAGKFTGYDLPEKTNNTADAPILYSYYRLNTGTKFICQIICTDMSDNSNRPVPFCHFIMSTEKENGFAKTYPIHFWRSLDFWNKKLKNTDELPPETTLPTLNDIRLGHLTGDSVTSFLNKNNRIDKYAELLTAVEIYFTGSASTHGQIVIYDSNENIASWINVVTRAFPLTLADKITFSTYQKNPTTCDCIIIGAVKKAAEIYLAQHTKPYYIFDFLANTSSPIGEITKYASTVRDLVKNGKFSSIERFCSFCDTLKSEISFNDLVGLLITYSIREGSSVQVDLLPTAIGVIKKLYQEPITVIQPIIEATMRNIVQVDAPPYKIAQELLQWSNERNVPVNTHICVLSEFLTLFFEKILPSCGEDIILNVANQYNKSVHGNDLVEKVKEKISKGIESAVSLESVVRLIKFANMINALPLKEKTTEYVMRHFLLPSLASSAIAQQCAVLLIEKDLTGVALNSFLLYLKDNTDLDNYLKSISTFLTSNLGKILIPLLEKAKDSGFASIYSDLSIYRTGAIYPETSRPTATSFRPSFANNRKTTPFLQGINVGFSNVSPYDRVSNLRQTIIDFLDIYYNEDSEIVQKINQFVNHQWARLSRMTETEIAELIRDPFLPLLLHDGAGLAELFMQMLVESDDLISFSLEKETPMKKLRKELLNIGIQLINKRKYTTLNSIYTVLTIIDKWENMCIGRELSMMNIAYYESILDVLPDVSQNLKNKIMKYAVQMLVRKTESFTDHSYCYDKLNQLMGKMFTDQYDMELFGISPSQDMSGTQLATIFKTLQNHIATGDIESPEKKILNGSFKFIVAKNEKRIKALKEAMNQDVKYMFVLTDWLTQVQEATPPKIKKYNFFQREQK